MLDNLLNIAGTVAKTALVGTNPLAGLAIQQISSVLLEKKDGTPEEIDNALTEASTEQIAQIQQIDRRFKGIKETTELIQGVTLLAVFLTKHIKDGLGVDDVMALFQKMQTDPAFQSALIKASEGIQEVPAELDDLDFEESITLGVLGLNFVKEIVSALKEGKE
jgi:hypothetical protein